jgi:hypothetical protein
MMASEDVVPPAESIRSINRTTLVCGRSSYRPGVSATARPCIDVEGDGNDVQFPSTSSLKRKRGRLTSELMEYFVLDVGGKMVTCKACRRSMAHQSGRYRQHLQACPSFASTYRDGCTRLRSINVDESHDERPNRRFGCTSDSTRGKSAGSEVRGQVNFELPSVQNYIVLRDDD